MSPTSCPPTSALLYAALIALAGVHRAAAQPIGSATRAITLVAIKPAPEAIATVSVGDWIPSGASAAGDAEVTGAVGVRANMTCEIRVRAVGGQGAVVMDDAGIPHQLAPGVAVPVYRGQCVAASPLHYVRIRTPNAMRLEVTVTDLEAPLPRRWVVDVTVPGPLS